jgi:hypothetical protein
MHSKPALILFLVAATCSFDTAASGLVPIEWSPEGRFAKELTVPATKFIEICGQLPSKTKVAWAFEASVPLNFNVHYHEGQQVHYPTKQDGVAKASGDLDAPLDQDYCWMWTNKSSREATLKFELTRR